MNDSALLAWVIPVLSLAGALLWLRCLYLVMPALRADAAIPADARYPLITAVVMVAILLSVSSLSYSGLIPADWSRFLLMTVRAVLLVTGAMTWWELRR